MNESTGFNTPDDDGADDALNDAEAILDDAARALDESAPAPTADQGDAEEDEQRAGDALDRAQARAAEHLADLQRLQAEYVNYRKRVDRDRAAASDLATARAIESLIPALDDIAAAREHGDLTEGPFASIAEKLETALGRLGWSTYGAEGDPFDPQLHEALLTKNSADAKGPTVLNVAQPGHKLGDRVLRPARVVVVLPEED